MASGTSGMGMTKHGKSGRAGKSPKFRHHAKMEAEKNDRKAKPPLQFGSVSQVFNKRSA